MRGGLSVVIAFASAGCDLVFSLDRPGPGPTCFPPTAATTDPGVDSDGDGTPDVTDNCPGVPNMDQHDEDGDCRGDACDSCPHDVVDPDGPDADGDGIGDACDPDPAVKNPAFFDPFLQIVQANWSERSCTWVPGIDVYDQPTNTTICTIELMAGMVSTGLAETRVVVPQATIKSGDAFSVGLGLRWTSCSTGCSGDVITLSRDAPSGDVWLRASILANGQQLTTITQRLLDGALDGEPVGLSVVFRTDGSAAATATVHGVTTPSLPIPGSASTIIGSAGLFTQGSPATFQDMFFVH